MRPVKIMAIAGGVIMGAGGCTGIGKTTINIDGHVFLIPKEYLVQGIVPWLPTSQSEGLKFIIDPSAESEEQMIVTVESASMTCSPRTLPASNQLASACAAALQGKIHKDVTKPFALEKVLNDEDPTQWGYRLKGTDAIVSSCYALDDNGKIGLCMAINNYDNLIYSIGLRHGDMDRLPQFLEKVNFMLTSWEKKSING